MLDKLQPAPRRHVSDHVFDELARAILQGAFAPGSQLPSERLLVERFHVSRNIARQALHRLAELGLVAVRQGGATVVRDPNEATDLRVLSLFYRLIGAERPPRDTADMIEKQYLQGLSIVETAARRASPSDLSKLASFLDQAADDPRLTSGFADVEEHFWRTLSAAAQNRIFRMEVAWWYETLPNRPVPPEVAAADPRVRLAFCRELVRRLAEKDHPTEFYLATTRPLLDAVIGRLSAAEKPRTTPGAKTAAKKAKKA